MESASRPSPQQDSIARLCPGDLVPHFILPALGGGMIDRGVYRGRQHLVFLFTHGAACGECAGLLATMRRLHHAITCAGAEVLLVRSVRAGESREQFVGQAPPFPVVLDDGRLAQRFGLSTTCPTESALFVADRHGELRLATVGSSDADETAHGLPLERVLSVLELLQVTCSV